MTGRISLPRVIMLAAALLGACAPPPYLKATAVFADQSDAGLKSLNGLAPLATRLCFERAQLDRLNHRLLDPVTPWGSRPSWSKWLSERTALDEKPGAAAQTWQEHCEAIRATEPVVHGALGVLARYVAALKVLSQQTYDGTDVSDAAQRASDIAKSLGQSSISESLGATADPLKQLAKLLLERSASSELRRVLGQGEQPFQQVLAGLGKYLDAIEQEYFQASKKQGEVLDLLENRLNPAAHLFEFLQFARVQESDLDAIKDSIRAARQTLAALRAAHAQLVQQALTVTY